MVDDQPTHILLRRPDLRAPKLQRGVSRPGDRAICAGHVFEQRTVKLAEEVGYDKVADLAKAAGITSVKATPAMALGAYDATPLDMAAAYTVFANDGMRISPTHGQLGAQHANGDIVAWTSNRKSGRCWIPRVAFVMTNMMEGVMNFGTAFARFAAQASTLRQRARPAVHTMAGSPDTPAICLCIVWVGYDDYSDIRLSGAQTAAPIWAEFMKKAVALSASIRTSSPSASPPVWWTCNWTRLTNLLANASCPETYTAAFIAGTEPNRDLRSGNRSGRILLSHVGNWRREGRCAPGRCTPSWCCTG